MRIAKLIARGGKWSRRQAEVLISEGRVTVNGRVLSSPALNVSSEDRVLVDAKTISSSDTTKLWMVNKMRGELVTRVDPKGRATVFDRLMTMGLPEHLMPVGRLDYNTEGLLLLTNDGDYARTLELPSSNIPREYVVRVYGTLRRNAVHRLERGLVLNKRRYKPIKVNLNVDQRSKERGEELNWEDYQRKEFWMRVVLAEGKNREVREALGSVGLVVNRLIRTSFGPYTLGKLPRGLPIHHHHHHHCHCHCHRHQTARQPFQRYGYGGSSPSPPLRKPPPPPPLPLPPSALVDYYYHRYLHYHYRYHHRHRHH